LNCRSPPTGVLIFTFTFTFTYTFIFTFIFAGAPSPEFWAFQPSREPRAYRHNRPKHNSAA
jgi:hypothetical protein